MNDSPILKDKRAVVFGAGGSIGAAVARQFSADGAEVFLAGRTKSSLDAVTRQITDSGGRASYAVVDTLDDAAVDSYLSEVVEQAGRIDIEFNATGPVSRHTVPAHRPPSCPSTSSWSPRTC